MDASGNRSGTGQGRRRGLPGQTLGRRQAAGHGRESAGTVRKRACRGNCAYLAPPSPRGTRTRFRFVRHRVRVRRIPAHAGTGLPRRARRRAGADHRPERRRQGTHRADRARQLHGARQAAGRGQLRRAAGRADRGRTVRRRSRRVHRRGARARRPFRGGRRRYVVPRRDRQFAGGGADETLACVGNRRIRATGFHAHASREGARDQRDQCRPARADPRGQVPRRPLLSPQHDPGRAAAAGRAARRHPAAGRSFSRWRAACGCRARSADRLSVARQRARTEERHRPREIAVRRRADRGRASGPAGVGHRRFAQPRRTVTGSR